MLGEGREAQGGALDDADDGRLENKLRLGFTAPCVLRSYFSIMHYLCYTLTNEDLHTCTLTPNSRILTGFTSLYRLTSCTSRQCCIHLSLQTPLLGIDSLLFLWCGLPDLCT